MKTLKSLILCVSTLFLVTGLQAAPSPPAAVPDVPPASMTASADQPATLASQQSFIQSGYDYFTSFNTNLGGASGPFNTNSDYQVWMGAAYQSGVNLGVQLAAEANPFKGAPGLMVGEVSTFAPQVGTIADQELDFGWSIVHIDTRLTAGGAAAYCFGSDTEANKGLKGGFFAEVQKALTQNTFSGLRGEGLFGSGKGNQLIVSLEVGATF